MYTAVVTVQCRLKDHGGTTFASVPTPTDYTKEEDTVKVSFGRHLKACCTP